MDKSLSSPFANSRSPFLSRARQNNPLKRSITTPRKSSRFSVSGKSTQSTQVILKSQHNAVERFGTPLPVLVTEALTFADRNTAVSANMSECGYAWVVVGRRLLVWQYRHQTLSGYPTASGSSGPVTPQSGRRPALASAQCHELQLPQSDLAHRAELVTVFVPTEGQTGHHHGMASCIAVSPEGVVRYWPNASHDSVTVEHTVELQGGQECDTVRCVPALGACVLATTTCTVVLVQTVVSNGRHSLICRTLRSPSGWLGLGGISRRMSSFIFGPIAAAGEQTSDTTRPVRVITSQQANSSWTVYVLANHSLQKWKLYKDGPDTLIHVFDLTRLIREGIYKTNPQLIQLLPLNLLVKGFGNTIWENVPNDHQSEQDTWLLDMQEHATDNILFLAGAVNLQVSQAVHYALVTVDTSVNTNAASFREFRVLKMSCLYREDSDVLQYQLLWTGNVAYVYNKRCINVIKTHDDEDCLEFNLAQDYVLGGSICVNTPIFFSRSYGLISVSGAEFIGDMNISAFGSNTPVEASFNDSFMGGVVSNLSIYNMDATEVNTMATDAVGQLKSAFLYHINKQLPICDEILQTHFPAESTVNSVLNVDCLLDKVVIAVCEELLDDVPGKDPRWTNTGSGGIGSSYAMQILHQLEDKQKAFSIFLKFLKDVELWQRLCAVTWRDTTLATVRIIAELEEKLICAILLKCLPQSELIERTIERCVGNLTNDHIENGLSHKDIYFREVTKVSRFFKHLIRHCEKKSRSDFNPTDLANLLHESNEIILSILKEIVQIRYKQNENHNYSISDFVKNIAPDYLPWTTAAGNMGIYDYLLSQQSLTYNYGIKPLGESPVRSSLYDQLVDLVDIILDGRKCHLESIKKTDHEIEDVLIKQYQKDRNLLISPFIESGEYERALQLSEKYLDFESMATVCDLTGNNDRLDEYMTRFNLEKFPEFLYQWYLKENKRGVLIDKCRNVRYCSKTSQALTSFLQNQPELSWLQDAFSENFKRASGTLRHLADSEAESLQRQKTIYSMSKLARLAAVDDDLNNLSEEENIFLDEINAKLEIIAYQEEVPDYVLTQYGYDTIRPRVIPVKELVHLHICFEYKEAGEVEFKKALDLLQYLDDDTQAQNDMRLTIWRAAILRDNWTENSMASSLNDPWEALQQKVFFKIVELSLLLANNEIDPHELLPPLDILLEHEDFALLKENKTFVYLMKTGYDHVFREMEQEM